MLEIFYFSTQSTDDILAKFKHRIIMFNLFHTYAELQY